MDRRHQQKWSKTIGGKGENDACALLTDEHCSILLRNYRPASGGELDIVARDGETLVFVEVKTRFHDLAKPLNDDEMISPGMNLHKDQKERIAAGVKSYLNELDGFDPAFRVDLIEVVRNRYGVESILHHKSINIFDT